MKAAPEREVDRVGMSVLKRIATALGLTISDLLSTRAADLLRRPEDDKGPGPQSAVADGIEIVVIERQGKRAARLTMIVAGEHGQRAEFYRDDVDVLIATLQRQRAAMDDE